MRMTDNGAAPELPDPVPSTDPSSLSRQSTFRFVWCWTVSGDPFGYGRSLNQAWVRADVPPVLLVSVSVTGRVAVAIQIQTTDLTVAVAKWGDFPLRAIRSRRLREPRGLSLSVVKL